MSKKTSYLGPLVHIGFLRPFAFGILRRWLVHRETMVALVTTLELTRIARTLQVTIWHVQGADIVITLGIVDKAGFGASCDNYEKFHFFSCRQHTLFVCVAAAGI